MDMILRRVSALTTETIPQLPTMHPINSATHSQIQLTSSAFRRSEFGNIDRGGDGQCKEAAQFTREENNDSAQGHSVGQNSGKHLQSRVNNEVYDSKEDSDGTDRLASTRWEFRHRVPRAIATTEIENEEEGNDNEACRPTKAIAAKENNTGNFASLQSSSGIVLPTSWGQKTSGSASLASRSSNMLPARISARFSITGGSTRTAIYHSSSMHGTPVVGISVVTSPAASSFQASKRPLTGQGSGTPRGVGAYNTIPRRLSRLGLCSLAQVERFVDPFLRSIGRPAWSQGARHWLTAEYQERNRSRDRSLNDRFWIFVREEINAGR